MIDTYYSRLFYFKICIHSCVICSSHGNK